VLDRDVQRDVVFLPFERKTDTTEFLNLVENRAPGEPGFEARGGADVGFWLREGK
jgi:hypothetical protein